MGVLINEAIPVMGRRLQAGSGHFDTAIVGLAGQEILADEDDRGEVRITGQFQFQGQLDARLGRIDQTCPENDAVRPGIARGDGLWEVVSGRGTQNGGRTQAAAPPPKCWKVDLAHVIISQFWLTVLVDRFVQTPRPPDAARAQKRLESDEDL